ncbi:MAG: acylneuraminate cytidylyltransferase family protein [Magnetococcales bacterium]|nr:acylneuraminate cytidylyltransferase family protein [Magnetococcales bacterium]
MSKIVALIPARAGSKGVPDKNIRLLGGRPLLAWTIAACQKVPIIDRVIVSTDSPEYAKIAQDWGAEAPFLRPVDISDDNSSDYEFIEHALNWLASTGEYPEYFVHMRPTTPLRKPQLVAEAIEKFIGMIGVTALRSVHEMAESAYKTFEMYPVDSFTPEAVSRGDNLIILKQLGSKGTAIDIANSARQQFPSTYQANGYVDVLSTEFIRKNGILHGDKVMPYITPTVAEVDTLDDFALLEFQCSHNPEFLQNLFE